MRTDTTTIGDDRRQLDALLGQLPGDGLDGRTFSTPWELRAFAIAVAACQNGNYEWSEFQRSLIHSITRWEQDTGDKPWSYFEHWLTALETVLTDNGLLPDATLDDRTREVLAVPRDANHHQAHREPVATCPAVP